MAGIHLYLLLFEITANGHADESGIQHDGKWLREVKVDDVTLLVILDEDPNTSDT